MARDVLDLVDALDWKGARQLHIIGTSMGGMIAQHVALIAPERIASLTLSSTTSNWFQGFNPLTSMGGIGGWLIPRSKDQIMAKIRASLLSKDWMLAPDEDAGSRDDECFVLNADRWTVEQFLTEEGRSNWGAALQAPACVRHAISKAKLKEMADLVGRDRIQLLHGVDDETLPLSHGKILRDALGQEVMLMVWDGCKHMPQIERRQEFRAHVIKLVEKAEAMR